MNMCGFRLLALKGWLVISFALLFLFLFLLFFLTAPGAHFVGGRRTGELRQQRGLGDDNNFTFAGDRT
jgi:hypothetical protein